MRLPFRRSAIIEARPSNIVVLGLSRSVSGFRRENGWSQILDEPVATEDLGAAVVAAAASSTDGIQPSERGAPSLVLGLLGFRTTTAYMKHVLCVSATWSADETFVDVEPLVNLGPKRGFEGAKDLEGIHVTDLSPESIGAAVREALGRAR